MATKILQVNFKFNVPRDTYEQAVAPMANDFAAVQGCRWKIWLMNEETSEAEGIYLFDDDTSLNAYLGGPLVAAVTSHPALSDFSVKHFDTMEAITKVTRGPIEKAVSASERA